MWTYYIYHLFQGALMPLKLPPEHSLGEMWAISQGTGIAFSP